MTVPPSQGWLFAPKLPLGRGAVSAAAVGVLLTFPADPLVWNIASWTLVAALALLLVLVLVSGYVLATIKTARTTRRVVSFLVGLACLAALGAGSL